MFLYNFYLVTWFVFFESLLLTILSLISLLISIAYFTLAERKFIASVQRRCGPNIVGFWGLLQPLADGLKLVLKEIIIPNSSNQGLFIIAPLLTLILSFSGWVVIPNSFDSYIIDLTLSLMFILLIRCKFLEYNKSSSETSSISSIKTSIEDRKLTEGQKQDKSEIMLRKRIKDIWDKKLQMKIK